MEFLPEFRENRLLSSLGDDTPALFFCKILHLCTTGEVNFNGKFAVHD